jgi:PTS system ascorbate-specific IIA component
MAVGILVVSHNGIGAELIKTAKQMLACEPPLPLDMICIEPDDKPEKVLQKLDVVLLNVDKGDGVLMLTDMFGSTPSNIACSVSERDDISIISGLNLPMLIRVLNYPTLTLKELEQKAISGGQEGVLRCHQMGFEA